MSTTGTDIDIDVLRSVYNMPIEQAAKQLGVCVTVLKRICRRKGIPRWPYRKLKSINKMISSIEEFSVGTEQGSVSAHLEKLKLMRENILRSPEVPPETPQQPSTTSTPPPSTNTPPVVENNFTNNMPTSVYTSSQQPPSIFPTSHILNQRVNQSLPPLGFAHSYNSPYQSFTLPTIEPSTCTIENPQLIRNDVPKNRSQTYQFVNYPPQVQQYSSYSSFQPTKRKSTTDIKSTNTTTTTTANLKSVSISNVTDTNPTTVMSSPSPHQLNRYENDKHSTVQHSQRRASSSTEMKLPPIKNEPIEVSEYTNLPLSSPNRSTRTPSPPTTANSDRISLPPLSHLFHQSGKK